MTGFVENQRPNKIYWFGTNDIGQDLWARMWSGTRTSLLIGLIVAALNAFVGILGGLLWGYVRKLDFLFTELYNLVNNIPSTIILILAGVPVGALFAWEIGIIVAMQISHTIPTTMSALLNSLQMGFRTLAIQKRSGEVWKVLGAVKTEFNTFASVLESTQKRLAQAGDDLDKLVGVRTRKIQSTLKQVEALPAELLPAASPEENDDV